MRRRPSGSTTEEDEENSSPEVAPSPVPGHGDKAHEKSRDSGRALKREAHVKDRRKDSDSAARSATGKSQLWTASPAAALQTEKERPAMHLLAKDITPDSMVEVHNRRRSRLRNPWACSLLTLMTTCVAFGVLFVIGQSFMTRQLDPKGCDMSYMRPSFARFSDFDTEHTRFASKYSLYLYREGGIDEDTRVNPYRSHRYRVTDNF